MISAGPAGGVVHWRCTRSVAGLGYTFSVRRWDNSCTLTRIVTLSVSVAVHPLKSVTTTEYTPDACTVMICVESSVLQAYVTKPAPASSITESLATVSLPRKTTGGGKTVAVTGTRPPAQGFRTEA